MIPFLTDNQRQKDNAKARKAAKEANKYQKETTRYENREGLRRQRYQKEGIKIARANSAQNIALQQLQLDSARNYQMQIRQLDFENQQELQEASLQQAAKQRVFNKRGYNQAIEEQNNYMLDQKINFELDRINIDIKDRQGVDQYMLSTALTDQQQRATRAKGSFAMQAEQLKGLKSLGLAQAKGQAGRTAGKNAQAAVAESGFQQAVIAEETSLAGEQYRLDSKANAKQLRDLSEQLIMQNQEIDLSEDSLNRQDKLQREKLKLQFDQANAEAMSRIRADPKLAPMIPETPWLADYGPEFQDEYEWKDVPEPPKIEAQQDRGTLLTDTIGWVSNNASMLMGGLSKLGGGDGQGVLSFLGGDIRGPSVPNVSNFGRSGGGSNYSYNMNIPQFNYDYGNFNAPTTWYS